MYKQVETTKEIKLSPTSGPTNPVATLKNDSGGVCEIVVDDHCYMLFLKRGDEYIKTPWIFREAHDVLKTLPPLSYA